MLGLYQVKEIRLWGLEAGRLLGKGHWSKSPLHYAHVHVTSTELLGFLTV